MLQNYTPEFKKKSVRPPRLEEGRTINSITTEYGISKESVRRWCNEFQKECQLQSLQIPSSANEAEIMKDNLRLRRELAEKEKGLLFLKNSGILRKGNRLEAYRLAEQYSREFDVHRMLRQPGIRPKLITTIGNTERRVIMPKRNSRSTDWGSLPYA